MTPPPTAEGLLLCEKVIIDQETESPSCIGVFSDMSSIEFHAEALPFYVFATLTDAQGTGIIKVVVTNIAEDVDIEQYEMELDFPDRFAKVIFVLRIVELVFPGPGRYGFSLFADEDLVAQCSLNVDQ